MDKVCQAEKIILVYSDIKDLILHTDQGILTPSEILVVHEMIRKSNDPDYHEANAKVVMRYTFCVENRIKEITIKNEKTESLPINLENSFISRNVGLVVNEDKEYIDLIARAIEQAETQRSLVLESLKVLAPLEMAAAANTKMEENTKGNNDHYYGQNYHHSEPENKKEETLVAESYVAKKMPAMEQKRQEPEYQENFMPRKQTREDVPVAKEVSTVTSKPIHEEKVISVKRNNPAVFASYARENFISTSTKNIAIDYEKVAHGKNGNGYKIQIIAKLLDDHNSKTIQKYYGLPYTVEEDYDGTWHRYTLSGYSNSWDKSYALLQEIRNSYGIEDAFISLYQDHERIGIYPCNTVGFAEWIQEKTDNGFEPLGSKERHQLLVSNK
jgi:hypothetical protein